MNLFLLNITDWFNNLYNKYQPMFDQFFMGLIAFVPKFVGALLLLFLGWFLGRMIARFFQKLLERIGADKLGDRLNQIDFIARSPVKLKPSTMVGKFLYYVIFIFFFMAATDTLGITAVSEMISKIFEYLPRILSALVVFVIGILFADMLKKLVHTACISLNIPAGGLIANFVFYFVFINVAMITLSQAGIDTNFIQDNLSIILAGIVGAFAVGYGYASRPLVGNLLASYYNKSKVKVGDLISIDGVKGKIVAMDNSTMTLDADDRKIIVPLNKLSSEKYEIFK
ncbi:mechanosensitive ion channel domain-containing protein [Haliscomenobacter sp.]|uniref:mechanosensitive ion channel family protein n=1 Tax=Haliscomenobacter sp. TaxID=2717303 RepID=UPI00359364AA